MMRHIEFTAFKISLEILQGLSVVHASDLGGSVASFVGPKLPVSKVADANLQRVFTAIDAAQRAQIVKQVWNNLGRIAGELPHLNKLARTLDGPGWEVVGEDILRGVLTRGGPALFFSGHIGNWEMLPVILAKLGIPMASIYRALSNSAVNDAVNAMRRHGAGLDLPLFPKGAIGAREAIAHLKRGGYLGMLVDQKMNDGIPVKFFGQNVMTAPALAAMALRFRCPVIPGHIRRLGPARFRLEVEPPLELPNSGDRQRDIAKVMWRVNQTLERWIIDEPGAWLWLHRRWPKNQK